MYETRRGKVNFYTVVGSKPPPPDSKWWQPFCCSVVATDIKDAIAEAEKEHPGSIICAANKNGGVGIISEAVKEMIANEDANPQVIR